MWRCRRNEVPPCLPSLHALRAVLPPASPGALLALTSHSTAGVFTGIAIALHNIPEGLATFVGALSDAKVSRALHLFVGAQPKILCPCCEGQPLALPAWLAVGLRAAAANSAAT